MKGFDDMSIKEIELYLLFMVESKVLEKIIKEGTNHVLYKRIENSIIPEDDEFEKWVLMHE